MVAAVRLRPAEASAEAPGAGRSNAVINALIEELPPMGADWPVARREAWLDLMRTAFVLAYGGAAGGDMRSAGSQPRAARAKQKPGKRPRLPKSRTVLPSDAGFHIDVAGFARDPSGERCLPEDVAGPLLDRRGEGDLSSIRWADDTFGIPKGMQLDVTIAPV